MAIFSGLIGILKPKREDLVGTTINVQPRWVGRNDLNVHRKETGLEPGSDRASATPLPSGLSFSGSEIWPNSRASGCALPQPHQAVAAPVRLQRRRQVAQHRHGNFAVRSPRRARGRGRAPGHTLGRSAQARPRRFVSDPSLCLFLRRTEFVVVGLSRVHSLGPVHPGQSWELAAFYPSAACLFKVNQPTVNQSATTSPTHKYSKRNHQPVSLSSRREFSF